MIRAFSPASSTPLHEEKAHAATVASLFVSPLTGTLLSGSWDCSAKVWASKLKHVLTLEGHENSVWAVGILPESGVMVTGSADMSLRLWVAGKCRAKVEKAHGQVNGAQFVQQITLKRKLDTLNLEGYQKTRALYCTV